MSQGIVAQPESVAERTEVRDEPQPETADVAMRSREDLEEGELRTDEVDKERPSDHSQDIAEPESAIPVPELPLYQT